MTRPQYGQTWAKELRSCVLGCWWTHTRCIFMPRATNKCLFSMTWWPVVHLIFFILFFFCRPPLCVLEFWIYKAIWKWGWLVVMDGAERSRHQLSVENTRAIWIFIIICCWRCVMARNDPEIQSNIYISIRTFVILTIFPFTNDLCEMNRNHSIANARKIN